MVLQQKPAVTDSECKMFCISNSVRIIIKLTSRKEKHFLPLKGECTRHKNVTGRERSKGVVESKLKCYWD